MRLVHTLAELGRGPHKACLSLGFFDGVHLGHQQIIRKTIADARQHEALALVITFDRHPNTVVAPQRVPPLIYSLPQKLRAIEVLGADTVLVFHFDEAFSRQTGEAFINGLADDLGEIKSLCVGADFVFGYKRSGNVELLRKMGAARKFDVHALAAVSLDGKPVSSTRIREAIKSGDLDAAGQMLGRAYSLAGTVIQGDGVGRKLGFPTANLDVTGLALPPGGVYVVHAQLEGKTHRAVMNIGFRPTLNHPKPMIHVEAHLLDYSDELYGKELEITFMDKLREERKFAGLAELRQQIAKDIQEARARF